MLHSPETCGQRNTCHLGMILSPWARAFMTFLEGWINTVVMGFPCSSAKDIPHLSFSQLFLGCAGTIWNPWHTIPTYHLEVYVCVCIYIWMYVWMYVCMFIYCLFSLIYKYTVYVYIYICVCVCLYIHIYTYVLHMLWHSIWHPFWHTFRHLFWHFFSGPLIWRVLWARRSCTFVRPPMVYGTQITSYNYSYWNFC